jgi:hypothetical protein
MRGTRAFLIPETLPMLTIRYATEGFRWDYMDLETLADAQRYVGWLYSLDCPSDDARVGTGEVFAGSRKIGHVAPNGSVWVGSTRIESDAQLQAIFALVELAQGGAS